MARHYEPCGYVTQAYPAWAVCSRPVEARSGAFVRCPKHRAHLPYWPGADCNHVIPGAPAVCLPCSPRKLATPRALPQVEIEGELYFVDEPLREYRSVAAPWKSIRFEDAP